MRLPLAQNNKKQRARNNEKESAQDGKWPLEIDACAGIIELVTRFTLATVFSFSVVIRIDIPDASSLYHRSHLYFISHYHAQKVTSTSVSQRYFKITAAAHDSH
jgi:hypothetical protein